MNKSSLVKYTKNHKIIEEVCTITNADISTILWIYRCYRQV